MAEFQWWLLIVGLVAGGGLVAVVLMSGRRREEDLGELERRAETSWIADRLRGVDRAVDRPTVDAVLRLHREYLSLPPPDELVVVGAPDAAPSGAPDPLDRHPDDVPDDVRDDRRGGADEDLAHT